MPLTLDGETIEDPPILLQQIKELDPNVFTFAGVAEGLGIADHDEPIPSAR
jgi:hypothetical protein